MAITEVIEPRRRDLGGGFVVLRSLPAPRRRSVGPFVFVDQMGPVTLPPGQGLDVRPHPHIGLATVTYLYAGAITHRDSLGFVQDILPGDVNWMVAGRGIVHSERSPATSRSRGDSLLGLQCWVALPRELEDCEPSFAHHAAATLPGSAADGVSLTLIAGRAFGLVSPVSVQSPLCHARLDFVRGAHFALAPEHEEIAVYLIDGELEADGRLLSPGELAVLSPDSGVRLDARTAARAFVIGGERLAEPRQLWWNFVATSDERIDRARQAWLAYGEMPFARVPDDPEFIPLPDG